MAQRLQPAAASPADHAPARGVPLGIALLSSSALLFEVALTRLCSAALDYHLAFLAVSAALLGTAAGGTWVALRPAPADPRRSLCLLATGAAAGFTMAGAAFAWAPLGRLGPAGVLLALLAGYPLVAVPACCASAALATVFCWRPHPPAAVYAADLLGAGAGCLAVVPVTALGGPLWTVVVCCALALAAAAWFRPARHLCLVAPAILAVAIAGALRPRSAAEVIAVKPLSTFLDTARYPGAALLATRWDAFSRVDVFRSPGAILLWAGASVPAPPDVRGITIDADALSAVLPAGDESRQVARRLPTSLPYAIAPRPRVLVVGPGGGADVAAALAYDAGQVDAVEVNRQVVQVMLGPLAGFSGDLYRRPGVRLVVDEGRSFVRRSPARYDAIVLTAVDSWAAQASGAYSLAENALYTREAFADYYTHLTDGGVVAVSRWSTPPAREMQRLTLLAALEASRHDAAPDQSLLLLQAGDFGTLLMRRGPFTADERIAARTFAGTYGFDLAEAPARDLPAGLPAVSTDDRPFFFDFLRWSDVLAHPSLLVALPRGHAVLLLALVQALCMAFAAVTLPLRRLREPGCDRGALVPGAYFAGIGVGFMLAEIALLQRLTVFLGHPALSLGVTLAALLVGAGAGSRLAAGRCAGGGCAPLAVAALLLAAHGLVVPGALERALEWPLAGRIALALLLVLPAAVAMGPAVPAGIARLDTGNARLAAWAWGINGAAAAAGTALAVMLAMDAGASVVLLASAACYAVCAVLLASRDRRPAVVPPQT